MCKSYPCQLNKGDKCKTKERKSAQTITQVSSARGLRMVHLNARSIKSNYASICTEIVSENLELLSFSESWFKCEDDEIHRIAIKITNSGLIVIIKINKNINKVKSFIYVIDILTAPVIVDVEVFIFLTNFAESELT